MTYMKAVPFRSKRNRVRSLTISRLRWRLSALDLAGKTAAADTQEWIDNMVELPGLAVSARADEATRPKPMPVREFENGYRGQPCSHQGLVLNPRSHNPWSRYGFFIYIFASPSRFRASSRLATAS